MAITRLALRIGHDLQQAAYRVLFEGNRVVGGDQAVFLGDAENFQLGVILYPPEDNVIAQMIRA